MEYNICLTMQKFRLYLKRLSGVAQGVGPNSFCGSLEPNPKLASYGRFEIQALAASGQLPPQTLAALHAELLGQPTANVGLPAVDHQPPMPYGQTLQSNITKQSQQPVIEDVHSGFGSWHSNNMVGGYRQNGHNMLLGMLQSQSQSQKQSITVQPSCLVLPAQSSPNFQAVNNGVLVNQATSFNRSSVIGGQSGQTAAASLSVKEMGEKQISFGESAHVLDQGPLRGLGFVGQKSQIPRRFAVYEAESPTNSFNLGDSNNNNINGRRIKQEPNIEYLENSNAGRPHRVSQNDLMSVFSD